LKVGKESKNKNKLEEKAMRRILFLLGIVLTAVLVFFNVSFSQMSGTYYIGAPGTRPGGGDPDFTSLKAACDALMSQGVGGNITFYITSDLTEPQAVHLGVNTGGYTITFKPSADEDRTITFTKTTDNTASSGGWVIGLSSDSWSARVTTENIIIDGYADGGSTRRLTLQTASTAHPNHTPIHIIGDVNNVVIKNCILKVNQTTTGTTAFGAVSMRSGRWGGVDYIPDNIVVDNCIINTSTPSGAGIFVSNTTADGGSTPTGRPTGLEFKNNIITVKHRAISLNYSGTTRIYNNEIYVNQPDPGYASFGIGGTSAGLVETYVYNNKILQLATGNTGGGGNGIRGIQASAGGTWYIYNNFITGFSTPSTGTTEVVGIRVGAASRIYYNTIVINDVGTTGPGTTPTAGIVTYTTNCEIKNNIIITQEDDFKTYCIYASSLPNVSDYNLLYRSGTTNAKIGYYSVDRATLSDWQNATGKDAYSVSKNVTFVSATDLHLASPSNRDPELVGTPISEISKDIDGDDRHSTYPFKGADEGAVPVVSAQKVFDNGGTSTTPGTSNYPVLKVRFTTDEQWAKISGLTVKKFVNVPGRTLADGEVTLNVYNDANGNNIGESVELLGSVSFSDNSVSINFPAQTVTTTGLDILLTINVSATANPSHWVALKIESPDDVNVTSPAVKSTANYPIQNENDISLPVQVASVLADVSGRDVRIKIKTQTEPDDFLGFNVYRSRDGENFVMVGSYESVSSLRAKGNMAYGGEYEFVDKGLNSGRYQYKIEAVSRSEKKFVGDVISVEVDVPKGYALHQNYPNPFNPVTVIEFEIPEAGYVLIELYNSVGQKVRDIFAGELPAGYHRVRFDASGLSSGVYFYRMSAGKFNAVRKMVIMK
jgi:hypothetical protein